MPNAHYLMRQGDTGLVIRSTLRDHNGDPVSIQGASVDFAMVPINGSGTPAINADASNDQVTDGTDGTMGKVSYTFASPVNVAGMYLGEWEVTYGGGAVQTFPNDSYVFVRVTEQIA